MNTQSNKYKLYTDDDRAMAVAMFKSGHTLEEIGEELERTPGSIYSLAHSLGWKRESGAWVEAKLESTLQEPDRMSTIPPLFQDPEKGHGETDNTPNYVWITFLAAATGAFSSLIFNYVIEKIL